jgi:hypothetical protein
MNRKNYDKIRDIIKKKCQITKPSSGEEEIEGEQFYRMLE